MRLSSRVVPIALACAFLAACEGAPTQVDVTPQFAKSGSGVIASATGSGVRTGSIRHFQFSAVAKANGSVSGQFTLSNEGAGNVGAHGQVLCLRVDGNRAWIGTRVTSSTFAPYVNTEGGFYVEDNGEGSGSDDRLSLSFVGGAPGLAQAVCDGATTIEFGAVSIDQGNIQVH